MSKTHDYRWGIPRSHKHFTPIPNYFLDHYADLGINPTEFLLIVHLARYKFDRPGSESKPAVGTVAAQMGLSERHVRRMLAAMEERGWVRRLPRTGEPNVYDYSQLTKALWKAHSQGSPDAQVRPTEDTDVPNPRVSRSPKQEKQEQEYNNSNAVDASRPGVRERIALLVKFGISEKMATELAEKNDSEVIQAWIRYATEAEGLRNPQGFVVSGLRSGKPAPTTASKSVDAMAAGGVVR